MTHLRIFDKIVFADFDCYCIIHPCANCQTTTKRAVSTASAATDDLFIAPPSPPLALNILFNVFNVFSDWYIEQNQVGRNLILLLLKFSAWVSLCPALLSIML